MEDGGVSPVGRIPHGAWFVTRAPGLILPDLCRISVRPEWRSYAFPAGSSSSSSMTGTSEPFINRPVCW